MGLLNGLMRSGQGHYMNSTPKVFIIILNWNGLQDTLECLESVHNLHYSNFKVIVVDNGSSDDSVEIIRETYPRVTLIENKENLGFTGGNNIAMRYAKQHGADYVWLLNNDTVVESGALSKIVAVAEKSPDIGLVSPVIYYYDEPDKIQFCGSFVDWNNYRVRENKNSVIWKSSDLVQNVCLWGAALLIKISVIEQIGYLNEKFFAYYEDFDYSVRAAKVSYRNVVELGAVVWHKGHKYAWSSVETESPLRTYLVTRNAYFFWMGHLKGLHKFTYFKNYCSDIIITVAKLRRKKAHQSAEAVLDAARSAFNGFGGPRTEEKRMSKSLEKLFDHLFAYHPYFWANLLKGDFINIISETLKRAKAKCTHAS